MEMRRHWVLGDFRTKGPRAAVRINLKRVCAEYSEITEAQHGESGTRVELARGAASGAEVEEREGEGMRGR